MHFIHLIRLFFSTALITISLTTQAQLIVGSGAKFMITGNAHVVINENIINNGKIGHNSGGTVNFNGTALQYITGTALDSVAFFNLQLNNPEGLSTYTHLNINNTFQFQNGSLFLNDYNTRLTSGATFSGNNDTNRFFVTNGIGMLFQNQTTVNPILYPIGTATGQLNYTPSVLANTGTADNFGLRVMDSVFMNYDSIGKPNKNNPITANLVQKTWVLDEAIDGGSDMDVKLYWNGTNEGTGFQRASSAIYDYKTYWDMSSATRAAGGANPYFQSRNFTNTLSYRPITVSNNNSPLPVTLISFKAYVKNNAAQLEWVTASEINNQFFEIERSTDGVNFQSIDTVEGNGTTNIIHRYTFKDDNYAYFKSSNLYYRLRQMDYNGNFEYSPIRKLDGNNSDTKSALAKVSIYPNPVINNLTLDFNGNENETLTYSLTDLHGKLIVEKTLEYDSGINIETIDMSGLEFGIYTLIIKNLHSSQAFKIVKK